MPTKSNNTNFQETLDYLQTKNQHDSTISLQVLNSKVSCWLSCWLRTFWAITPKQEIYQTQGLRWKVKNQNNFHSALFLVETSDKILKKKQNTLFLVPFPPNFGKNEFSLKSASVTCKKSGKTNEQIHIGKSSLVNKDETPTIM